MIERPQPGEYREYFRRYIDLVPEGNLVSLMKANTETACNTFASFRGDQENYAYAPNKWTVKDMLLHIIDTERIMAYRALVAARGDHHTSLASVDENLYAANADASERSLDHLLLEFKAVRESNILLFESLTEQRSQFIADGPVTARAVAYILLGHTLHHLNILNERYKH